VIASSFSGVGYPVGCPNESGNCRLNLWRRAGKTIFSITQTEVIAAAFGRAGGAGNRPKAPTSEIENRLQPDPRCADPVFFTPNLT